MRRKIKSSLYINKAEPLEKPESTKNVEELLLIVDLPSASSAQNIHIH